MVSIVIIGSGNVAQHLITAFLQSNEVELIQVFSRQKEKVLHLLSSDKIVSEKGDEGGVVYKKYITRDLKIELSDEYILESTYAHEQLYSLAEELAEMPFMIMMVEILKYSQAI